MEINDMLMAEVLEELPHLYEMPAKEVLWVERMLNYNVKGGKMNRGLMVVESVKELAKYKGQALSPQEVSRFAVLGWAIEWMQAWLLMADDIMDDSPTRRGQPCWYKNADVQKIAINDAFFVEVGSSTLTIPSASMVPSCPHVSPEPFLRLLVRCLCSRCLSATSAARPTTFSSLTCSWRPLSRPSAASCWTPCA
jgi:hypothetical protein